MNKVKLSILSIYKHIFFIITLNLNFLLMIVEILIMIFTLNSFEIKWCNKFNDWCIKHLDNVLQLEFKLIFKTK